MTSETYPYLWQLLGGYFHQDAWDDSDSVEDIVREFQRTSWPDEQLGVRADIRRLLRLHEGDDNFLQTLTMIFSSSVLSGKDDAAARAWLHEILRVLEE